MLRKKQKQGDGAGALELNDLDVQEWSVVWQELLCSQQRAIQQNTPYDIISQIVGGKKVVFNHSNHITRMNTSVSNRGLRKYDFEAGENESSIIHRNQNEESFALGSFN